MDCGVLEIMDHFYQNIQGMFRWPELYKRAVDLSPKKATFVEIGCFKGRSTAYLAVEVFNSCKDIQIHAIDLWDTSRKIGCSLDEFVSNMTPVLSIVNPIRLDSIEAHKLFPDESLDFVWVDGNHTYPYVLKDIRNWWKKLKVGGWMGGDDLIHGGVRQAVVECFGEECSKENPNGRWIRFQSSDVFFVDKYNGVRPTHGGLVWWSESKK